MESTNLSFSSPISIDPEIFKLVSLRNDPLECALLLFLQDSRTREMLKSTLLKEKIQNPKISNDNKEVLKLFILSLDQLETNKELLKTSKFTTLNDLKQFQIFSKNQKSLPELLKSLISILYLPTELYDS